MDKKPIEKISPEEAWKKIRSGAFLLDVRRPDEFSTGHVEGAVNVSHDQVLDRLAELPSDTEREIVVYCKAGGRADFVRTELQKRGYTKVFNAGGFEDLSAAE